MCAGYQTFTTVLAKKLTPLVVQGCLYNIALKPFVHEGYNKHNFKKPLLGLCCTIVVQLYSGFCTSGYKTHKFFEILEKKRPIKCRQRWQ